MYQEHFINVYRKETLRYSKSEFTKNVWHFEEASVLDNSCLMYQKINIFYTVRCDLFIFVARESS